MSAAARLGARGLSAGFGGHVVVEGVSFDLEPGQVLCLVGPNGSGKSTLLKTISRQIAPLGGSVYLNGADVHGMRAAELARTVSVMLTGHLRTEMLTCLDVVETGRYPYTGRLGILGDGDRARVREAMELVDAWELRDRDFMQVSDGQRQRVLLARAVAQEPAVMVLDEPTSYLDVRYQLDLLNVLRGLARERGTAAVVTLHEIDLARKVADRVLCVRDGRPVAYGAPEDVLGREGVHDLFDLGGGSYNPVFGNVEDVPLGGAPQVFVVAGGGLAADAMRALRRAGVPFAAGVVARNDVDWLLARDLTSHVVDVPAFAAVDGESLGRALAVLGGCKAVVDCLDGRRGPQNELNGELARRARELGIPVFPTAAACLDVLREGA